MQIVKKKCNLCNTECTKSLRIILHLNIDTEVEICYSCISRMYDESGQTKFTYTNPFPYTWPTTTDKKWEVMCWNQPVNRSL